MQEYEIISLLMDYLKERKIKFLREVNLGGVKIDFLVKEENRWVGVEVKGSRADPIITLGQLVNYYQYLSHLYLCAPPTFIRKIVELIISNPEISHLSGKIGFISIKDGRVEVINPPSNGKYYISLKKKKLKRGYFPKFPKYGILDEIDNKIIEICECKKDSPTLLGEIQRQLGISYEALRKRVRNLEHFGYLRIISKYPICVMVNEKRKAI